MTSTIRYLCTMCACRALQGLLWLSLSWGAWSGELCTLEEQEIALALAIYWEDRTSEEGMMATGRVIINRSQDKRWHYDLCRVIYQPSNNPLLPKKCAFSFTCDGLNDATLETDRYKLAETVAKKLISGYYHYDITQGAVYYYRCELHKRDSWMENLDFKVQIGDHCFFRD